ncbi:DMT family transporter [Candidatus Roizmanbacteria bacterium]|nr:DMT family transporter [Candidatus Roizmanbacteria bacterium]
MTTLLTILIILFWGVWGLFAKIASTRIGGEKAFFYDIFSYFILTLIIVAIFFRKNLFNVDKSGLIAAFLAGIFSSIGGILFFVLLNKKDATTVIPLTALYPMITVILAVVFLKESLTTTKIFGIIFAIAGLLLLNL